MRHSTSLTVTLRIENPTVTATVLIGVIERALQFLNAWYSISDSCIDSSMIFVTHTPSCLLKMIDTQFPVLCSLNSAHTERAESSPRSVTEDHFSVFFTAVSCKRMYSTVLSYGFLPLSWQVKNWWDKLRWGQLMRIPRHAFNGFYRSWTIERTASL